MSSVDISTTHPTSRSRVNKRWLFLVTIFLSQLSLANADPGSSVFNRDQLLKDFSRAQQVQLKSIESAQKAELRDLESQIKSKRKAWLDQETDSRHKFFKDNKVVSARRVYIRSFFDRRKTMESEFKTELAQRRHDQEERRKVLKEEQATKLKEFKTEIDLGHRPPDSLWPN